MFDAETHTYRVAGRVLPSVTRILNEVIPRQFHPGAFYLGRGSALHAAISLYASGRLDFESVDPRYLPRLEAFQKFERETGYRVTCSEMQMASLRLGVAGTADAILENPNERRPQLQIALTDFKSSLEPTVVLQIAGYSLLLKDNNRPAPETGLGLELREDGNYFCRWIPKRELLNSENVFKHLCGVYHFKAANGLLSKSAAI